MTKFQCFSFQIEIQCKSGFSDEINGPQDWVVVCAQQRRMREIKRWKIQYWTFVCIQWQLAGSRQNFDCLIKVKPAIKGATFLNQNVTTVHTWKLDDNIGRLTNIEKMWLGNKVDSHSPPLVNSSIGDEEMKRWKQLKNGANGSSVFRIHVESELKLGLSVSITLLPPGGGAGIRSLKLEQNWEISNQVVPGELGFNIVTVILIIMWLSEKQRIIIQTIYQVLGWPACMVVPSVALVSPHQNLRNTSHRRCHCHHLGYHTNRHLGYHTYQSSSWLPMYQSSSWLPITNLQVDFLAKLSLGLSLSDQRSPDPAPRTRWDVSDYDEIVWHVVVTLTEM